MEMTEIKSIEFVRSAEGTYMLGNLNPDVTWFLVYTGEFYFCRGGDGAHSALFEEVYDRIPEPLVPGPPDDFNRSSVVAAGRIKEIKTTKLLLWGSKNLRVTTPEDWRSDLEKVLEEQVIPEVLAVL